ncbi:PC4-domain-containing protein [Nadsonia fulvescens var. elongata DSM 6958]|uniref:PC4-domain-containing protein n=1 Tax=Nadsonia fulvescens var. elongata DSM 6958 TaxID=857566 RepID=A0A1E3PK84_9ASCO|nr:PC4-domain-containing protein [Nadsonia fulvescens var. elongata DSM 6958]
MPPKRYNKSNNSYANGNYKKYKADSPESATAMYPRDETVIELGSKKRVTVRSFKGIPLVDIREYYSVNDSITGEPMMLPGKKGISLSLQLWEQLMAKQDEINKALNQIQGKPSPAFPSVNAINTTSAGTGKPTSLASLEQHIPVEKVRPQVSQESQGIQLPDPKVKQEFIESTGADTKACNANDADENDAALELELGELLDEDSDSEA